ncbi:MAG: 2-phosphosulfolactate phosphatase [Planctomycetota bacterium]
MSRKIDVIATPDQLTPRLLIGRTVVIFDVLRATTSIATALANGSDHVEVHGSLDDARASTIGDGTAVLAGERECLPPPGFDLGNSPAGFTAERVAGKRVVLTTSNGTRAILAAGSAAHRFTAAMVNARATAEAVLKLDTPITLLCAGTDGEDALEDWLGAGALLRHLRNEVEPESDRVLSAALLFESCVDRLPALMSATRGGRNVILAGLADDIAAACQLDIISGVNRVEADGDRTIIRQSD